MERYDTFSDAPQASSADAFGTQGVNIWAIKPRGARRTAALDLEPAAQNQPTPAGPTTTATKLPPADEIYDAGSLGCGDGPLTIIAAKLRAMPAGAVLEVRSTDPGVAADLPAWCRMVGHTYLGGGNGTHVGRYLVRRKDA